MRIYHINERYFGMQEPVSWEEGWTRIHEILAATKCAYPGCYETAAITCCMIGCNHKVCETHGNCSYELSPDEDVPICWLCCGKGWGEESTKIESPGEA